MNEEKTNSLLFSKAEHEALLRRIDGDKNDPTGIYASRVKPKIIELFTWFEMKNKLKKLIK